MLAALVLFLASALSSGVQRSAESKPWPSCVLHNTALRSPQPAYGDVRPFIRYPDSVRHRLVTFTSQGNIGMALQEQPHDLGEVVKDAVPGSQAESAGVRKGWIITEIDGRPFSPSERLKDVAEDFARAKRQDAILTVKFDVRTFLDCFNGDCSNSDQFPADSMERCAEACLSISGCNWWSFGAKDGDNMCSLQSQAGSSLIASAGRSSAPQSCAPKPSLGALDAWPQCIARNSHIYNEGSAIFTDVRQFISRADEVQHRTISFSSGGNIGMGLTEGGVVNNVLPGSQALLSGVQKGWIVKELDGRPFTKDESLAFIQKDFNAAKSAAPGLILKFDVKSSRDCTDGLCIRSDKLPVASEAACANVCGQLLNCRWWSFGIEEGDTMCWLRNGDKGLRPMEGSSTGRQSCQQIEDGSSWWWWVVLLGGIAFFRQDIFVFMKAQAPQALKVLERLTSAGQVGSAHLTSELFNSPGYGSSASSASASRVGGQELEKLPRFDGALHGKELGEMVSR